LNGAFEHRSRVIETRDGYSVQLEEIVRSNRPRAKSIVFVNGALATSRSFRWAIASLPGHNLIFFDLPHIGNSKQFNFGKPALSQEAEVETLRTIIDRCSPDYLASMSWGGFTALHTLSRGPSSVQKAIIASFSNKVSGKMISLLREFRHFILTQNYDAGACLLNSTLGKFLPRETKRANYLYLMGLGNVERDYIISRIDSILSLNATDLYRRIPNIKAEILFMNGEFDEFADWADLPSFTRLFERGRAAVVPETGHFLAAENRHSRSMTVAIMKDLFDDGDIRAGPCESRRRRRGSGYIQWPN